MQVAFETKLFHLPAQEREFFPFCIVESPKSFFSEYSDGSSGKGARGANGSESVED